MKPAPLLLVVGLLFALMPLPALAGDATNPEIKDPAGDGAASGKDIVSVWVAPGEDGKSLDVGFEAGATITPEYPSFHAYQVRFTLWFKPTTGLSGDKKAAYVAARIANGQQAPTTPSPTAYFGTTTAAGTFDNLNNEITLAAPKVAGKQIVINLPLTSLKGFTVGTDAFTQMYANVVLAVKGPAATAGGPDVNMIRETYDRAPNTGFGADFAGAGSQDPAPDFTIDPVANQTLQAGEQTTVAVTITNNGTAANVTLSANSSSPAVNASFDESNVSLETNGTTVANLTLTVEAGASGDATIELVATAGNVTRTLSFTVLVKPASTGNATNNSTAATNETGDLKAAEGGGIPALQPLLVLGALACAAAIRVRRRIR